MNMQDLLLAVEQGEGLDIATDFLMAITLISVRIQAFLYLSPFFSRRAMLRVVRVGFILAMTIILLPATFETVRNTPDFQQQFLALTFKELIVGLVLGFLMWMPVRGLEFTGVLLDTQRGNTQAMGTEVVFGGQSTPTAIFLLQLFTGYFFAVGGFQIIQTTLFRSAEIWPFTKAMPLFEPKNVVLMVDLAGVLIFSAVALAIPIAALMFLADIVIALIARNAPTLNALIFGMPVKSFIMCIMLFFYIEIAYPRIMIELERSLEMVRNFLP
jgi:type III secretion protein T